MPTLSPSSMKKALTFFNDKVIFFLDPLKSLALQVVGAYIYIPLVISVVVMATTTTVTATGPVALPAVHHYRLLDVEVDSMGEIVCTRKWQH